MVESKTGPEASVEPKRPVCQPHVDIHESETGLVLRADLPGVTKETLELMIEENVLKIFGRSTLTNPPGSQKNHHEFRLGDFYRSFILGDEIDTENIKAELESGVLTLKLPKRKVRPRRIDVD
jgi:HSP20 family molecular chaperone IbpA